MREMQGAEDESEGSLLQQMTESELKIECKRLTQVV